MYLDKVTSEWRTNFPSIRYRTDVVTFEVLPLDVQETLYWISGADSVFMPMFYSEYEKTFLFYIGAYTGMGYMITDRLYDEKYFNESRELNQPQVLLSFDKFLNEYQEVRQL